MKKSVLIVEDEQITASSLQGVLSRLGYAVAGIAPTGEAAVEMAARLRPDIVLMDIMLGDGIDGIEAASRIAALSDVPVVYVTSYSDEATLLRAKITAPFGYIIKPFTERDIATCLEITLYRKEIERRLRDSEERFRVLAGAARDAIVMGDEDARVVFWNRAAETMFGITSDEAMGRPIPELMVPARMLDEFSRNFSMYRDPARGMTADDVFEAVVVRRDGGEFPVEIAASALELKGRWHVMGLLRDITRRKKQDAERQRFVEIITGRLKALDCLYKVARLVERADRPLDEIFRTTAEHLRTALRASARAGARIEYDGAEYRTESFAETASMLTADITVRGAARGRVQAGYVDGPDGGAAVPFDDEEVHLVDAVARELGVTAERKIAEEELRAYQENLEDLVRRRTAELTEANRLLSAEIELRKATEDELREATLAAMAASRAKTEFLSNMSHELRTPLNSIIGFAKLMKMGYDPDDYGPNLDKIIFSGTHLLKVFNEILQISRIESGRFEIERKPVDLARIIAECGGMMEVQAAKRNIAISIDAAAAAGAQILGDEAKLQEVFINLLSNAVKFTDEGGRVAVRARTASGALEVDVSDTGVGISPEHAEYVFEKFARVETGLTRKTEGTGLGLSIARKIVEAHGGAITLKSAPGEGSTFTVRLPIAP